MKSFRRYRQIDFSGLLVALVASCIFHGLLLFILMTTTIYYPMTSDREKIAFDFIWTTLGSEIDNPPAPSLPETSASTPQVIKPEQVAVADDDEYEFTAADTQPDKETLVLTTVKSPPPSSSRIAPVKKSVTEKKPAYKTNIDESQPGILPESVPPVKVAEKPAPVEIPKPVDKQDLQNANAKLEQTEQERIAAEVDKNRRLQEEQEAANRQRAEQEQRAAELARKAELERQARAEEARQREVAEKARKEKLTEEKARLERLNKIKREDEQRAREKLARDRLAAEKIAAAKLEQERNALKSTQNSQKAAESGVNLPSTGKSVPATAVMTNRPSEPVVIKSVANDGKQPPIKESNPEGITLPPIKGDIKVIVQSEGNVIVKINFINYPRAKHNKAITRNEARELKKLTPIIVRNANHTIEAVIEHATDGIYVVLVEPKDDKPIEGNFSLKLLDSAIKSVGKRKVAGPTEIARILMPEGVLWSDDNAFSGNIEDSESITKFNADTGLIWKEYRK